MSRRPIQVLLAATAVCLLVGATGVAGAGARSRATAAGFAGWPRASLGSLVCHHARDPINRSVADTAFVRPVPGTTKEAVNFRLFRRTPSGTVQSVQGSGLGTWMTKPFGSAPVDLWRVIHTVTDLSAPARYRFSVSFRWIGSSGQILAHATRYSRGCHQPELRPDLEVTSIAVSSDPGNIADDLYTAQIKDAGASGARYFQIELSDQGQTVTRRVARIAAHQTLSVRLAGPVCDSSDPPTVTVDPAHRVDVYSRAQATLTASCPASTSPSGSTAGG